MVYTHRRFHSSYERGCQGKKLLPAPREDAGMVTYIQPHHTLRGVIGLAALARRAFQRRGQPQLLVPTRRFHEAAVLDAIRLRSYASEALAKSANQDPMLDSRPTAFLGYPRGHRIDPETRLTRRLGAKTSAHRAPNERFDTLPRTRASQKPTWPPPRQENLGRSPGFCSILKRLAFSVVRRRNVLPSSKVSK